MSDAHPNDENNLRDVDDTSRIPERVEYYSGTVLTFLVIALIGFAVGAIGMMLILG